MGYKNAITQVDVNGIATITELPEIPFWSLDPAQVAVVLLICKGVLSLEEGVNVTGLNADHLINEAQAWAVASHGIQ